VVLLVGHHNVFCQYLLHDKDILLLNLLPDHMILGLDVFDIRLIILQQG